MVANILQESKSRQAELIKEADRCRLIKSLQTKRNRENKVARALLGLAAQLSLI